MEVSVYDAKSKLSEMINKALEGEEVIITRNGEVTVKLVPVSKRSGWVGAADGSGEVPASFFSPLDDEIVEFLTGEKE
jgi:prevent-host-death family protein